MRTIAIIGSGPTAIYTAKYLLQQEEPLSITMFEAQAQAGKGTPYHQNWNEREMLANIASIEIPPVTETLVSWLTAQSDDALAAIGVVRDDIDERTFFPRVALGEYFHAQLRKMMENAAVADMPFAVKTNHKVLDVAVVEDGIKLTVREPHGNVSETVFDYAVMATGHAWPKETEVKPGYFLSPWPAAAMRSIPHCHVGIRGTSLSAIDAMVALAVARGSFDRDANGELSYHPEPGTEGFRVTMMSRKGILPEADFYCPIPYAPLSICTKDAIKALVHAPDHSHLLDDIYALFVAELTACDPDYAKSIDLAHLSLEQFSKQYFETREKEDTFVWAERNLAEAKANLANKHTVQWRYAILRMHEAIALAVPHLLAEDYQRFTNYFKHIFVDDYATVPHESIERLLALHKVGKLDVIALGEDYTLNTDVPVPGVMLTYKGHRINYPAFIEAMGQRPLSPHEFPFKSLWEQGLLEKASVLQFAFAGNNACLDIGGIALDMAYHPVSDSPFAKRLYCLSLPFMLGQFPFSQGITSSHEMGRKVAKDMMQQWASGAMILPAAPAPEKRQAAVN